MCICVILGPGFILYFTDVSSGRQSLVSQYKIVQVPCSLVLLDLVFG
jgi:hypothetical protein